ncbi:3'-5' exonuclease [Methylosinus sp. Sm6]|uniref:3'-5' exonuclease n=1 Tax=Methylosinus sp. Sm6 TaxID=2866948 RepID=UPI001C9A0C70|nr:3'-5' exonuclease [Methylosinus sp. Sm6]
MLDLETLSTSPDAAIVAIGAIGFSSDGHASLAAYDHAPKIYIPVSPSSAQRLGGEIDSRTVQWWAQQSDAARAVLSDPDAIDMAYALQLFSSFIDKFGDVKIWGNGAGFDNVILRRAYERHYCEAPWPPHFDRCYRTLKNLRTDIAIERVGTLHNALDDAISQARHAEHIFAAMRSAA